MEWNRLVEPEVKEGAPLVTAVYASTAWPAALEMKGSRIAEASGPGRALVEQSRVETTEQVPFAGDEPCRLEASGYDFKGGRLAGHGRAIALVVPAEVGEVSP